MRFLRLFCIIVLSGCASFRVASAQSIRGRVVDDSTRAALPLTALILLDSTGKAVHTTMADDAGAFHLRAPQAGTYRVRAEQLGYRSSVTQYVVIEAQDQPLTIAMRRSAIQLASVTASDAHACRTTSKPDANAMAVMLEAMTNLERIKWTSDASMLSYEVRDYKQLRNVWRRVAQPPKKTESTIVAQGSPFKSPPIDSLMKKGFIRPGEGRQHFVAGPDVETLLSTDFQNSHCFRAVLSKEDTTRIGLRFDTKEMIEPTDIYGVLWVDRRTHELRHLDFRFTSLPFGGANDLTCGRMDFKRLPNGMGFISEWWIRIPGNIDRRPSPLMDQSGRQVTRATAGDRVVYEWTDNTQYLLGAELPGAGDPYECATIPK